MRTIIRCGIWIWCLFLALAGCGQPDGSRVAGSVAQLAPTATQLPAPPEGRWELASGAAIERWLNLPPGAVPATYPDDPGAYNVGYLTLAGGQARWILACDLRAAPYTLDGESLSINAEQAASVNTGRECAQSVLDVRYAETLAQVRRWASRDDLLDLLDDQGTPLLSFRRTQSAATEVLTPTPRTPEPSPAPSDIPRETPLQTDPARLEGAWREVQEDVIDHATPGPAPVYPDDRLAPGVLIFQAEQASWGIGCNTQYGRYTADATTILVELTHVTTRECVDERPDISQKIAQARSWAISGDLLSLFDQQGQRLIVFRQADLAAGPPPTAAPTVTPPAITPPPTPALPAPPTSAPAPALSRTLPADAPWVLVGALSHGPPYLLAVADSLLRFEVQPQTFGPQLLTRPGLTPLMVGLLEDGQTRMIVDPATGARINLDIAPEHQITGYAFAPDGSKLALLIAKEPGAHALRIVDLATGTNEEVWTTPQAPDFEHLQLLAWHDEGFYLGAGSSTAVGTTVWRLDLSAQPPALDERAHFASSYHEISRDRSTLLYADGGFKRYELRSGQEQLIGPSGPGLPPHSMTGDGRKVAYLREEGQDNETRYMLVIFDAASGQASEVDAGPLLYGGAPLWSGDGAWLLMAGRTGRAIRVEETATDVEVWSVRILTPEGQLMAAAETLFTPDPHITRADQIVAISWTGAGDELISIDAYDPTGPRWNVPIPREGWLVYVPNER